MAGGGWWPNQATEKRAAIIVGHGSVLSDAGSTMLRIADRLHQQQDLPRVMAGFLNYSQPTFAEAVEGCLDEGAVTIVVQPYFLIAGSYVQDGLQQVIATAQRQHPHVQFVQTDVLGAHSLLLELAQARLQSLPSTQKREEERRALLVIAHGTPFEAENLPIVRAAQSLHTQLGYALSQVGYLDCNQPDIPTAFADLVAEGATAIDVLPYFLHLGRHVRSDLPAHFAQAQQRHSEIPIRIARHLDDEVILSQICAERILEKMSCL